MDHVVHERTTKDFDSVAFAGMSMSAWIDLCVCSCVVLQISLFLSSWHLGHTGVTGSRGVTEKCFSAVVEKKYERDPKSRHRAPWIMSAAAVKKRNGPICSSIWMVHTESQCCWHKPQKYEEVVEISADSSRHRAGNPGPIKEPHLADRDPFVNLMYRTVGGVEGAGGFV